MRSTTSIPSLLILPPLKAPRWRNLNAATLWRGNYGERQTACLPFDEWGFEESLRTGKRRRGAQHTCYFGFPANAECSPDAFITSWAVLSIPQKVSTAYVALRLVSVDILTWTTCNHQLSQAGLTIGNERIVRWCNITDLQSIRNESRFWIGSLFFPKLADCLPTFVSFLSLAVLSLYRKLNAW